ncbi:hypothetical protein GE061_000205 [Apolygus lucorum]|uniref:Uncharacterized protein n=1 Tax=Apolygus lucorum TaxID=248454 RepID=A0A8S9Y3L5_APOLU|nr:hypothetical protein GE061_000205 [Apolygus lucorum]
MTSALLNHPPRILYWILKLRGALIGLNHKPFLLSNPRCELCSLCNLGELEDVLHFGGVCPILQEFRVLFLGRRSLAREELVEFLDDQNKWVSLAKYCRAAWG